MDYINFDISSLFSLEILLVILLGTFVGLLFGAIPGLGSMITLVLLLPVTYTLSPLAAVLLMLAAYQACEYGGSISSIVLGIPGTPAAAATILDGNTLARETSPGKALGYSLVASTIGGLFGGFVLILLSVPMSSLALKLSFPEYFLVGVLGILAVAALSSKDIIKSMISVVLGLMAGTVGMDLFTGAPRFTMGRLELLDGIGMVALIVGIFAFSEVFSMISNDLNKTYKTDSKKVKVGIDFKEFKKISLPTFSGSIIGSIIGIFPGLGAGTASWFGYSSAKKLSKDPQSFGKGNPEGIAGPESANNAAVGGALLPLLTLGIPGSPAIAVIMGAFIIHGITPGPDVFSKNQDLVLGIFYGFLLTSIAMFILGKFISPLFARVLTVSNTILIPIVLMFSIIGVFTAQSLFFELWLALIVGIIAFFMKKLDFSLPAFILAFVLSNIIEENLRRALMMAKGSYSIFFTRPFSLVILTLILIIILVSVISSIKKRKNSTVTPI
ncbi:tripartite tricarboxylate transporter permease [Sporosarcina sp. FSL W7-1349]|uniref:tripartite tricarboxylate transporter permease n=1 Tax=Sporosarcina sp. FSL W7-1349 TaxID=2921561 RepID=UPI0030F94899